MEDSQAHLHPQQCYHCAAPLSAGSDERCSACGVDLIIRGRYRIAGILGRGGFGVVYHVYDTRLQRKCALKVVSTTSRLEQQQIETEAAILAQHASRLPFIPEIYDSWSEGKESYLLMEFIEGRTLDTLDRVCWPLHEAEGFLRTMLAQLSQLHDAGIVHRDLKPKNIMLTADGRYVLIDFGISKRGDATLSGARAALSLAYAAPEQFLGRPTDVRSDLYSLAATTYFLLTGRLPAAADSRLRDGTTVTLPSRLIPSVHGTIERTLLQMLALDPAERPSDASAALALLDTPRLRRMVLISPWLARVAERSAHSPARASLIAGALVLMLVFVGATWGVAGRTSVSSSGSERLGVVSTSSPSARTPSAVQTDIAEVAPTVDTRQATAVQPDNAEAPSSTATQQATEVLVAGQSAWVRPAMAPMLWRSPDGGERVYERPRLYSGAQVTILEKRSSAVLVQTPELVKGWLLMPAEEVLTSSFSGDGEADRFTAGTRVVVTWPRGIPLRKAPVPYPEEVTPILAYGSEAVVKDLRGDWLLIDHESAGSGWARWYYDGARYIEPLTP